MDKGWSNWPSVTKDESITLMRTPTHLFYRSFHRWIIQHFWIVLDGEQNCCTNNQPNTSWQPHTPSPTKIFCSKPNHDRSHEATQVMGNVPHAPVCATLTRCPPICEHSCTTWTSQALQWYNTMDHFSFSLYSENSWELQYWTIIEVMMPKGSMFEFQHKYHNNTFTSTDELHGELPGANH